MLHVDKCQLVSGTDMKELISTAGAAFAVGALLFGVFAFPPLLVIAVLMIVIGMMADDSEE